MFRLKWSEHINNITKKANQTLGCLKSNIQVHNKDLKSTAYKTLVRPKLEYASTVGSPHTDQDIYKLESVQRRATRRVTRDYQGNTHLACHQCFRISTGAPSTNDPQTVHWSSYIRSHMSLWPILPLTT